MPAITQKLIDSIRPRESAFDIRDTKCPGFILRVHPTGKIAYVAQYTRNRRINIGDARILTLEHARNRARQIISEFNSNGIDPKAARAAAEAREKTLNDFLTNEYTEYVKVHHTRQDAPVRIRNALPQLLDLPLTAIDHAQMLAAFNSRKSCKSPGTVNTELALTKTAFQIAVDTGLIPSNPLAKIRLSRVDERKVLRYLTPDEMARLRRELDNLEKGDRLRAMVLVSLNTGIRWGELCKLDWRHVEVEGRVLTVEGQTAKSRQTRHIPLNDTAVGALEEWRAASAEVGPVFPGRPTTDGQSRRLDNISRRFTRLLAAAEIPDFTWHCLRHSFTSHLVQRGVDIVVVQKLLGHSDLKLTLRYSHLAPRQLIDAVGLL